MCNLRRKDKEIKNLRDVENILKEATVGRLGTCKDGKPYVVPICFVYNEGKILLHSVNEGKKIQHISQNPKVCFEVDMSEIILSDNPCDYSFRYKSVIVDGEARIVKRPEEKIDALIKMTEKYAPGKGALLSREKIGSFKNLVAIEIKVNNMVGKKSPV